MLLDYSALTTCRHTTIRICPMTQVWERKRIWKDFQEWKRTGPREPRESWRTTISADETMREGEEPAPLCIWRQNETLVCRATDQGSGANEPDTQLMKQTSVDHQPGCAHQCAASSHLQIAEATETLRRASPHVRGSAMRNSNNTSTTTRPSACGSTTKSEVQAPVGLARAMQQQKSDHFVGLQIS